MRALHWFRSDLRLDDNTALTAACQADRLIPAFVLDDHLIRSAGQGNPRLRFLLHNLEQLSMALAERGSTLIVHRGDPARVIPDLAREARVDLVTWNRDYGPYAKRRDAAVEKLLEEGGIEVKNFKDRTIFESNEIKTTSGKVYTVYTPYRRRWWAQYESSPVGRPEPYRIPPQVEGVRNEGMPSAEQLDCADVIATLPQAGEKAAMDRLVAFLDGPARDYHAHRDLPGRDGTSRLSPYVRFGVISVRECIRRAREAVEEDPRMEEGVSKWLDELVWREFYHAILDAFPHVVRGAFRREYDRVAWRNDVEEFDVWCSGQTGFPFVDAAMRQLNATGWMHNRARMVVASFLTKDLLIDWRWGERYFMARLVDGDPASNNGGWQWAASTGTDAQPYFRIFNPVSQSERFDPAGDYIRQWVPELRSLSDRLIHRPWEAPLEAAGYPAPIVDHDVRRKQALLRYEVARKK